MMNGESRVFDLLLDLIAIHDRGMIHMSSKFDGGGGNDYQWGRMGTNGDQNLGVLGVRSSA